MIQESDNDRYALVTFTAPFPKIPTPRTAIGAASPPSETAITAAYARVYNSCAGGGSPPLLYLDVHGAVKDEGSFAARVNLYVKPERVVSIAFISEEDAPQWYDTSRKGWGKFGLAECPACDQKLPIDVNVNDFQAFKAFMIDARWFLDKERGWLCGQHAPSQGETS